MEAAMTEFVSYHKRSSEEKPLKTLVAFIGAPPKIRKQLSLEYKSVILSHVSCKSY